MKKIILICSSVLMMASCTKIQSGYEGILIEQFGSDKGVQDVALVTGRVFYNPWSQDVEEYATFVKTVDYDPFYTDAKGGGRFTVDPTLSVRLRAGMAPIVFKKYRLPLDQIINLTIYNYTRDAYRIQMNKYTIDEVVGNREKFEAEVEKTLTKTLLAEGFEVENLTTGIEYPDVIVNAINKKNEAVQQAMESRNKLVRDSIEAKRTIIIATAQKEANELQQQSLTPLLVQKMFIEKWDGKTPLYGNAPTLFKNIQ